MTATLACCAAADLAAQPASNQRPKITAVRVGIANHYKVGHWTPVEADITGSGAFEHPRIEVTVIDSDGVDTTATANFVESSASAARRTAIAHTKVGRIGAPIRVRLFNDEKLVDETIVLADEASQSVSAPIELPPTAELLVALSSTPFGLERALPNQDASETVAGRRTVQLKSIADLPTTWFGYDAVDVLVISGHDATLSRELASDETRLAALMRWIELGGNLVVLCGGENAEALLAEGAPLATLLPGKFVDVVPLTELGELEQFAEPAAAIPVGVRGPALRVPRIADVEGHIEVYEGQLPTDLPLVVRSRRGFGEITFAGIDLASPPLAEWQDRGMLLQALLRPYVAAGESQDESQTLVARGYDDLSGALRQQLGRSFAGLVPIGFSLVAALAIAYLLVLGPVDYLIVQRWLRQPFAAWVTFPLIVLLFGTGAMGLAEWRRGSAQPRVNRLELMDVDMVSGQARGTFWATLHSPRAARFDLALQLTAPFGRSSESSETLMSWWGLPGMGVGGMQARGTGLEVVRTGYRYAADLESLADVPVLTSATKSLSARWTAPADALVVATLTDLDGFATGTVSNRTGLSLRNARLLYNDWGYWLGNLEDQQQVEVGEQLDLRRVKTIVTSSALGRSATGTGQHEGTMFSPERATALELVNLMMFYEAAGGADFAQLPSQVHAELDLSGVLRPGMSRAVLIAEAEGPGSQLIHTESGEPLGDTNDFWHLIFRFIVPVTQSSNAR